MTNDHLKIKVAIEIGRAYPCLKKDYQNNTAVIDQYARISMRAEVEQYLEDKSINESIHAISDVLKTSLDEQYKQTIKEVHANNNKILKQLAEK